MIKNIIFDLGGVVLNIDYHRTVEDFKRLGLDNFDQLFSQAKQNHLFDKFEKGLIDDHKFREELRRLTGIIFCDMELDKAWNAMLLDLPKERIDLLLKVKKQYRTFLFSNTNIIHYKSYTESLQKHYGYSSLGDFFEKEYYSHEIHLRKPDLEAFDFILKNSDLCAAETLFIDDSIQHIEGAKKMGINTKFIDRDKNHKINDLFDQNGRLLNY